MEQIDLDSLNRYEIKHRDEINDGVLYFLFYRGVLIYIGCSMHFEGRILRHMSCKAFDEVRYLVLPKGELKSKERELVKKYRPVLNGEHNYTPERFCVVVEDIVFCYHGKLCLKIEGNKLRFILNSNNSSNWTTTSFRTNEVCGYIDQEKCVYWYERNQFTYQFAENKIRKVALGNYPDDFMTLNHKLFGIEMPKEILFEDVYDLFN